MVDPIDQLIQEQDLHAALPVDLGFLRDAFDVVYLPFSGSTMGFAFAGESVSVIGINAGLHPYQQRMVLAHEATHLLCRHPNSFYLCNLDDWFYLQWEWEAQRQAARLLIPRRPLLSLAIEGATVRDLQEAFRVPADLVELRLKMVRQGR